MRLILTNIRNALLFFKTYLFLNIVFDVILIIVINSYIDKNFLSVKGLLVAINLWIFISYFIGRYHLPTYNKFLKLVQKSITAFAFSAIYFSFTFIFSNKNGEVESFINILVILSLFSFLCLIYQFVLLNIFVNINERKNVWIILATEEKFQLIENYIRNICYDKKIKLIRFEDKTFKQFKKCKGIIFDKDWYKLTSDSELLVNCRGIGFNIISLSKWFDIYMNMIPNEILDQEEISNLVVNVRAQTIDQRIKRLGDIFLSLLLLVLTSPIILVALISIWIEDRGPVFYKQTRAGFMNKSINIYKIRTMIKNSEKNGPEWSSYNDKRITKVGRFLRTTRIDELPQLFSVIKGEMSLIGPRPERQEIDAELEKEIKFYRNRYAVRPGISGWAQVNYNYGASIKDAKMKFSYDMFYIKNKSFFLDFLILLKTIKVVFTGQGSTPKKND